jgi:hypothetical protein
VTALPRAIWQKATASYAGGGGVDVPANLGDAVAIRNSNRIHAGGISSLRRFSKRCSPM